MNDIVSIRNTRPLPLGVGWGEGAAGEASSGSGTNCGPRSACGLEDVFRGGKAQVYQAEATRLGQTRGMLGVCSWKSIALSAEVGNRTNDNKGC